MMKLRIAAIVFGLAGLSLTACSDSASEETSAPNQTPAATEANIPELLFVSSAPENAVSLVSAKAQAKPGDKVVFEARVGGRKEPFVENRAVFSVADASLASCDLMPGDTCKTPWDYCCETPDHLLKHMATVQVVDADGTPLKVSLQNEHGLAPLKTVWVTGTVDQIDESGNFVINAETIYVKGS